MQYILCSALFTTTFLPRARNIHNRLLPIRSANSNERHKHGTRTNCQFPSNDVPLHFNRVDIFSQNWATWHSVVLPKNVPCFPWSVASLCLCSCHPYSPVENITPKMTPNRKIARTSLQLVMAMINVWIPLFMPRRSSFKRSSTVTTTFGETAVTTKLEFLGDERGRKKASDKSWVVGTGRDILFIINRGWNSGAVESVLDEW